MSEHDQLSPDDAIDIRAEFKQAWREAMRGNTLPTEELWKALDEDEVDESPRAAGGSKPSGYGKEAC